MSASRTRKHSVQPARPGAPSRRSRSPPAPAPAAFTVLGGLSAPPPAALSRPWNGPGPAAARHPALAGPPPCSPAAQLACPPAARLPQGAFGSMCPVIATDRGALTPEQAAPPPNPTSLFSKGQLGSGAGLLRVPPPGPPSLRREAVTRLAPASGPYGSGPCFCSHCTPDRLCLPSLKISLQTLQK